MPGVPPSLSTAGGRIEAFFALRRVAIPAILLALVFATAGCDEQRRVPYVSRDLKNWPRSYVGSSGLVLHVFETAAVHGPEILVLGRGQMTKERRLPVLAFVLEHPRRGLVVWGTGPSRSTAGEGSASIASLFNMAVSFDVGVGQELRTQMESVGLRPQTVRWVVLPNLRSQYAGQVEAFPDARIVVSRKEHESSRTTRRYRTADFDDVTSWKFVDLADGAPLATMPLALDFFADGSCMLLDATGPTAGNMALLIRLPSRPVLLAADLAPTAETLRYAALPAGSADADAWWDRIWRLKRFKDLDGDLLVVPGHDLDPLRSADLPEVQIHPFEATEPSPGATPTRAHRTLPGLR